MKGEGVEFTVEDFIKNLVREKDRLMVAVGDFGAREAVSRWQRLELSFFGCKQWKGVLGVN